MKLISIIENFGAAKREELPFSTLFTILPDTAMLRNNDPLYLPAFSQKFDCGVQLIIKISRVVKSIEPRFASRCYEEIGVAVSFTARDVERMLTASLLPTDMAHSFDKSTAISPSFISKSSLSDTFDALTFEMAIDGEVVQSAKASDMRQSIDDIISEVSKYTTLKIGDLILCGVPSSPINISGGQSITASLEGEEFLNFDVR